MTSSIRTFVALELPDAQKSDLEELQEQLKLDTTGLRWVRPEQLHLTLAFLGDVQESDIHIVRRAVDESARSITSFELTLQGVGAFPSPARPRVVWAGVGGTGLDTLRRLRLSLVTALGSVGHSPADSESFTAHITLGRLKEPRGRPPALVEALARRAAWSSGPIAVRDVVVYSSTPGPFGPTYSRLCQALLKGEKPTRDA